MPRVLVLTPSFITAASGAQVPAVVDLFRALSERHELEIHLVSPEGQRGGRIEQEGLVLYPHGSGHGERLAHLLASALSRSRFDVLWALWLRRTAPYALALQASLQKPLVASVIGGEVSDLPEVGYGEAGTQLGRRMVEALLRRSARITVGSPWLAEALRRRQSALGPRIIEAPFGVPSLPRRSDGPWAGGPLRLVAVTRVEPVKDPDLLLEAVAQLHRQGLDVSLEIYGYTQNTDLNWLAEKSQKLGLGERVRHAGLVRPEVLRAAYPRYHALVHSSRHESQGLALIEAAVVGLPIATTKVGVAPELVELGATVELAERDPDSLAAAIRAAVIRPGGEATRILDRYGLPAAARQFERALEEAASSKDSR